MKIVDKTNRVKTEADLIESARLQDILNLESQLKASEDRVRVLEEALSFYADDKTYSCWNREDAPPIDDDEYGKRARAVLNKEGNGK